MAAQVGKCRLCLRRQHLRMPENILLHASALTKNSNILDGDLVDQRPEVCGFGCEPFVGPDHILDFVGRKLSLKPSHSFGVSQLQNSLNRIVRVRSWVEASDIDIPEIRP